MDFESIFSLLHSAWVIMVVAIFVAIVAWTLWPSHKERLEDYGRIPLEDDNDGRRT